MSRSKTLRGKPAAFAGALFLLLALIALFAMHPLFAHGCSCGHDFDFHLQSWLDAAQQLRHGTLDPQWAFSPAWNAGEPRFVFYPPLSWLLGALLTLIFPIAAVPAIFTWIALTASACTMYRLARAFTPRNIAILAAALYAANPYMLFTAFERTAYAELLAAAWLPLLVLAALEPRPKARNIALPIALLWLTNDPAAVIGCYAFTLLILLRIAQAAYSKRTTTTPTSTPTELSSRPEHRALAMRSVEPVLSAAEGTCSSAQLTTKSLAGLALGLTLPAFYLLPAAFERRYVQIDMAVIPNMRIQDNFLFGHTVDAPHNAVLHTASLLAVTLLVVTAVILLTLYLKRSRTVLTPLITITLLIALLLTPLSLPVWQHLPELRFLQFPWRLLSLLAVVLALAIALLFRNAKPQTPRILAVALLLAAALAAVAYHLYRQPCDPTDLPQARAQLFATHHGDAPTDEYTPTAADNDQLRSNDPAFWLSADPNAPAPNTLPNPAATDPNFDSSDFTPDQTISAQAPLHFSIRTDKPEYLILNLRDYPNWDVMHTDPNSMELQRPPHIPRDDGLIAVPLYYSSTFYFDIIWRRTPDRTLGLAISLCALIALVLLSIPARSRKIKV
jgi:hypothetical protein